MNVPRAPVTVPAELAWSPQLMVAVKPLATELGSVKVKLATWPLKLTPSVPATSMPIAVSLATTCVLALEVLLFGLGSKVVELTLAVFVTVVPPLP